MSISKKEIKFVLITSLILILLSSSLFVFGYLIKGESYYAGLIRLSPGDGAVYFSYIEQVKQGNILLDNLFTNEPDNFKLFNPFWLSVGLVAKIGNLPAVWAYHLFRILLIPIFIYCLYLFVSYFLAGAEIIKKKLCLWFMLLAAGWGGLVILLPGIQLSEIKLQFPLDLFVPEASNFLILFVSPHFLASISLIILSLLYFVQAVLQNKISKAVLSGILALLLFSFHPFYILTVYGILAVYLVFLVIKKQKILWRQGGYYLLLLLLSCPAVIYYAFVLLNNASLQVKAGQNNCLSPVWYYFLISYGPALFFAAWAVSRFIWQKKLSDKRLFLLVWLVVGIFLIYSPVNFQRRLSEGWQIPLYLLAFIGLNDCYHWLKARSIMFKITTLKEVLPVLILIFGFTNIIFFAININYLLSKPIFIYLDSDIRQAMLWYQSQTDFGSTILSTSGNGNFIPGQIARRVFIGHSIETAKFYDKESQVKWFFSNNEDDQARQSFLAVNNINYILYSPQEKKLGSFTPQDKNYLDLAYQLNEVSIYRVNLAATDQ